MPLFFKFTLKSTIRTSQETKMGLKLNGIHQKYKSHSPAYDQHTSTKPQDAERRRRKLRVIFSGGCLLFNCSLTASITICSTVSCAPTYLNKEIKKYIWEKSMLGSHIKIKVVRINIKSRRQDMVSHKSKKTIITVAFEVLTAVVTKNSLSGL